MNTQITKLLFLPLFFLSATFAFAGSSGKNTANYYKADPDKHIGKKIRLEISHLTPLRDTRVEGIDLFLAHTVDSDERVYGGNMVVIVSSESSSRLVRDYGTQAERSGKHSRETKKISGILESIDRKGRESLYLDGDGKAADIIEANREKLKSIFDKAGHHKKPKFKR